MGILGLIILLLTLTFFTGKFRPLYLAEDLIMTGLSPVQGFFSDRAENLYFPGMVDYESA